MKKVLWIAMVGLLCLMAAGCGSDVDYYTISGQVYSVGSETDLGWPDVTVTLEGGRTETTLTDADGNYRFVVPAGEYRITPTLKGNSFDPPDVAFTASDAYDNAVDSNGVAFSPIDLYGADISAIDFIVEPFGATQSVNSWKNTGSMIHARCMHTSVLLPGGKVLAAGGRLQDAGGHQLTEASTSAEVYDPETNKWSTTGSMKYGRQSHTMSLLPGGKVLVAGGLSENDNARASAEIYDPETGTWSTTGSMTYKRTEHTMTSLPGGKVLVVGGFSENGNARASAEVYDPETETWEITGFMNYERYFHTATLLADGRVLVTGGSSDGHNARASAEIYDPETGTWEITGAMNYQRTGWEDWFFGYDYNARSGHTATLMGDGKVLVAGGMSDKNNLRASAEIYDPETGTWEITASMNYERYSHRMALLDDKRVLVTGGMSDSGFRASAEIYDLDTRRWTSVASMDDIRQWHTMNLLNDGRMLVTGGYHDANMEPFGIIHIAKQAEIFQPPNHQWTPALGSARQ